MKSNLFNFREAQKPVNLQIQDQLEQSFKETSAVLKPFETLNDINKTELLSLILDSIEFVKADENNIYIKLNKNLMIESENLLFNGNNLNIQVGGKIHLNPFINGLKGFADKNYPKINTTEGALNGEVSRD